MVLHTPCGLANNHHCTRAAGAGMSQCSYSDEKVFEVVRGRSANMSFSHFACAVRASKPSYKKQ